MSHQNEIGEMVGIFRWLKCQLGKYRAATLIHLKVKSRLFNRCRSNSLCYLTHTMISEQDEHPSISPAYWHALLAEPVCSNVDVILGRATELATRLQHLATFIRSTKQLLLCTHLPDEQFQSAFFEVSRLLLSMFTYALLVLLAANVANICRLYP